MPTTFDSTTEAEREIERAHWKAACLREHVPGVSRSQAHDLVTGDARLISKSPACRVRYALVVACLVGEPLPHALEVPCACSDCQRAA